MTTDDPAATVAAMPAALPNPARQKIFLYLGVLIILLAFGLSFRGGLIDIPISFFLKNKLHSEAHEVAEFRARGCHTPLSILCFRVHSRHLVFFLDARPRIYDVVRRHQRRPLRIVCLHPHYLRNTPSLLSLC